jgi:hypothetical protein
MIVFATSVEGVAKMKCPKKQTDCSPCYIAKGGKSSYICSGITTKPHKFRFDTIRLCLKGKYAKDIIIEMTTSENKEIMTALLQALKYK